MCNFHPSSVCSLPLQRKLANTAKTGRQKKPRPQVAFAIWGQEKKKQQTKKLPNLGWKQKAGGGKETLNVCGLPVTNLALYTQSPFILPHITFPFFYYEEENELSFIPPQSPLFVVISVDKQQWRINLPKRGSVPNSSQTGVKRRNQKRFYWVYLPARYK